MTFQFDLKMISQYGFIRYKKAKLLAKAVRKANIPDGCYYKSKDWLKIAEKLSADESVPTEYVPVRMMILSLESGYLNLVLNLYGQPELVPTKEMQKRIADLCLDLLILNTGRFIELGIIERARQIIDVISAFYIIRFANCEDDSGKSAKEYLRFMSLSNKALKEKSSETIDNIIEQIVKTKFDVPQSAKEGLINLINLIPIQNITTNYQKGFIPEISIKTLFDMRYPFDYISDEVNWDKEIDVQRILGMSQYLENNQMVQTVRSPILNKKPVKFRQIKHIYEKVLELKKQGIDPNIVAIKLQIEGIYLRNEDILEIYNVISEEYPEPDVLYSRSTKNLGLSQELLDYIKPNSPSGVISPKNKISPKNSNDSLEVNSPKSYLSDENQEICLKSKRTVRFKNESLKHEPKSNDDNISITDKKSVKIHPVDEAENKTNTKDDNSPIKNKMFIKIDPMDGVGEVVHCTPINKEAQSSSILGTNDYIDEEFL